MFKIKIDCVKKMNEQIFSSIKCRLGLDKFDKSFLENFIEKTKNISGCKKYILHSRIAIMGIDTMKNRSVPSLQYSVVEEMKNKYPDLNIVINGGIKDFKTVKEFNEKNIGVMIGREAYDNPWKFRKADSEIFNSIEDVISYRKQARDNKNWELADKIRNAVDEAGIVLKDSKEGTSWELK